MQTGGTVLGGAVLSSSAQAKSHGEHNTAFNPYALKEVKEFARNIFDETKDPIKQLKQWGKTGEKDRVFKQLSVDQRLALLDSIRPSVFVNESYTQRTEPRDRRPGRDGESAASESIDHQTITAVVDENSPIDKWGWDVDIVESEIRNSSEGVTPVENTLPDVKSASNDSAVYSENVYARAISFDWKAYEFTGYLHWDYTEGDEADNPDLQTNIGYTNSVTWHDGTETEVSNNTEHVQGDWEVTFRNGVGEICDPVAGWVCIPLSQEFQPYMTLEGINTGMVKRLMLATMLLMATLLSAAPNTSFH